jgi:hypothetical protein
MQVSLIIQHSSGLVILADEKVEWLAVPLYFTGLVPISAGNSRYST